ncbi:hypothetical protein AAVH_05708 [Aphelenchoides avenae]|nr:hypothetical protein AAVH_05708 [Aphelenchus avenae]
MSNNFNGGSNSSSRSGSTTPSDQRLTSSSTHARLSISDILDFAIQALERAINEAEVRQEWQELAKVPERADSGQHVSVPSSPVRTSPQSSRSGSLRGHANRAPEASWEAPKIPPNTPNTPSKPMQPMKALSSSVDVDPRNSVREEKAREAAVCLLKGLGTLDKPALHRSPAISGVGTPSQDRNNPIASAVEPWNTSAGIGAGNHVPIDEETLRKWNVPSLMPTGAHAVTISPTSASPDGGWFVDLAVRPKHNPKASVTSTISLGFSAQGKASEVLVDGRKVWDYGSKANAGQGDLSATSTVKPSAERKLTEEKTSNSKI